MAKATSKTGPKSEAKAAKLKKVDLNGHTELNGHNGSVDGAAPHNNEPLLNQRSHILQKAGTVRKLPLGLSEEARRKSCEQLNILLANTITLTSMYKKHHWQVSGHTFYQLHLLFDKHYEEQDELVDTIAERITLLGGVATGMPAAVARISTIENPPDDVEEVPVQISRLLEAHEIIMKHSREIGKQASESGDEGTNDMVISDVLRTNEMQVWFLASHLVDEPLVKAY